MNIHARDHLDNHGRIKAGQHLDIRSASLDNQENGELAAGVDREGKLTQRGTSRSIARVICPIRASSPPRTM
ncbi:hypothetical protein [Xenorhabdus szentirmaii]|uniref:hypothetical protein n=1 Tax=Xenorhabdus szentirmaii TaxID=290112 RepID=UPI0011457C69|nr:hypothetical protein [Xenorhabdus szentirmaii]